MTDVTETRLSELASAIRSRLKRTAEDIYLNGRDLKETKEILKHGNWSVWILNNFEMDIRTAQRFIAVYETFRDRPDALTAVPVSAAYLLAERATPDSAVEIVIEQAEQGSLTKQQVEDIVQSQKVKENIELVKAKAPARVQSAIAAGDIALNEAVRIVHVLSASPVSVQSLVMQLGVRESGVVNVLRKIYDEFPDEIESIRRTGQLQCEGEYPAPPIPLFDASADDAMAVYHSLKNVKESVEREAISPIRYADTRVTLVGHSIDEEGNCIVSFKVDSNTYRQLEQHLNRKVRMILEETKEHTQ